MKRLGRRVALVAAAVVLAAVALGGCALLVAALVDDLPRQPQVPKGSAPGQVVLASDACCCVLYDVTVGLAWNGGEAALFEQAQLYQAVLEQPVPPGAAGEVTVQVCFAFEYANPGTAGYSLVLDAEALRRDGLLLHFDESYGMGLKAKSGGWEEVFLFGN